MTESQLIDQYKRAIDNARPIGKHGKPSNYALAKKLGVSPQYIYEVLTSGSYVRIRELHNKVLDK